MAARYILPFIAALIVAGPTVAGETAPGCAASTRLTGPCFAVHGRLTACTGIPNARIWVIGTQRILGVVDASGNPAGVKLLPGSLDDKMFSSPPCSLAAFGDYTVCPLTVDRPGAMRSVCVARAANLVIRPW
jgi:hypothetical protein